jgi:hypothetical protein
MFGLSLCANPAADDDCEIRLGDREAGAATLAACFTNDLDLEEVIDAAAGGSCSFVDASEDGETGFYEFVVNGDVYSFECAANFEIAPPTWRFGPTADDAEPTERSRGTDADIARPSPTDPRYEARVLERALGLVLYGADCGSLCSDLGLALVDAANEVRENQIVERFITIADLSAMFSLDLGEGYSDECKENCEISLYDRDEATAVVAERGDRQDGGRGTSEVVADAPGRSPD